VKVSRLLLGPYLPARAAGIGRLPQASAMIWNSILRGVEITQQILVFRIQVLAAPVRPKTPDH
jgi:hypothetical protein